MAVGQRLWMQTWTAAYRLYTRSVCTQKLHCSSSVRLVALYSNSLSYLLKRCWKS